MIKYLATVLIAASISLDLQTSYITGYKNSASYTVSSLSSSENRALITLRTPLTDSLILSAGAGIKETSSTEEFSYTTKYVSTQAGPIAAISLIWKL